MAETKGKGTAMEEGETMNEGQHDNRNTVTTMPSTTDGEGDHYSKGTVM
jgi:hypothetical protein